MKKSYAVAVVASLSACGLTQKLDHHQQEVGSSQALIEQQQSVFRQQVQSHEAKVALQQVERPWVLGKPVALARELALPAILRSPVSHTLVLGPETHRLDQVAARIAQLSGLPVYVRPEALLPASDFLPRYARTASTALPDKPLHGLALRDQAISSMLDHVAASFGVYWRYQHGRIEFYRTETRHFNLRLLSQESQAQASLGLSNDQSSGFVSSSGTQLESSTQSSLEVIKKRLEAFLTVSGIVVAEPGAGNMVVVTDTPEVLDQVATYLERENRLASRRVRLLFEEITLALDDQTELAVDWDLVLSQAAFSLRSASHIGSSLEESIFGAQSHQGTTSGSLAALRALSSLGTVVRKQSTPVYTLNRRAVTHAMRTTFSYVDRVEAVAVGGNGPWSQPAVSVTQKEQTVGSMLTLLPDVQDDGLILLSVAYDNTVAQPLKSLSFGDRNSPLQVQQISIDGTGTVQQLALRPGQVWLISGFDRQTDEGQERRLGPEAPLLFGGAQKRAQQRWRTVLLVSAQLEEGD